MSCSPSGSCRKHAIPGRGETGCAFRGAKMALQPIADSAHLVHGVASCETGSWAFRPTASSGSQLHRQSYTTDLGENDLIQGGEGKLARAIDQIMERVDPPALFVYQTCLPAMIGDDLPAVCRAAQARWDRPVVPVDVPGFAGSRPYGNHMAAQALLDHVIGSREPEHVGDSDILLIGEFNLGGELDRIRPLLKRLGIRVLASLSGDGRIVDIACAHRAKAAVLLCSQGMAHLAEQLQQRYAIPVINGSFQGVENCSALLRQLAALLVRQGGLTDLPERTEALIAQEEARIAERMAWFRHRLQGRRVSLRCGGAKSWSLIATLQAAGMEVVDTALHKTDTADRAQVHSRLGHLPADTPPDLVLSGGSGQFELKKQGIAWLEVNHDRDFALSGYDGALELLARIDRVLANPVWRQLSSPAPWEDWGEGSEPRAFGNHNIIPMRR